MLGVIMYGLFTGRVQVSRNLRDFKRAQPTESLIGGTEKLSTV